MARRIKMTEQSIEEALASLRTQLQTSTAVQNTLTFNYNAKVTIKPEDKPTIIMMQKAYNKYKALVKECSKEVAWHGVVERDGMTFYIKDILVFPQTVTGATVNTDDNKYPEWTWGLEDDEINNLRLHGHSHVNMGVTPSSTDTGYQDDMLQNIRDYYIFSIHNKTGSLWLALYDVENNMCYEKEDIIYYEECNDESEWAKEMLKEYVKEHSYTTGARTGNYGGSYGNYGSYNGGYSGYSGYNATKKNDDKKGDSPKVLPPPIKEGKGLQESKKSGTTTSSGQKKSGKNTTKKHTAGTTTTRKQSGKFLDSNVHFDYEQGCWCYADGTPLITGYTQ